MEAGFPLELYKLDSKVGKGSFGSVFSFALRGGGTSTEPQKVAVKVVKPSR